MSDSYKKKYAILFLIVFLFFVFAYQFVKIKEINFDSLASNIRNSVQMSDFNIGDDQILRRNYEIDASQLENYVYIAPKSNMQVNEILIVKCKPGYVDKAYGLIKKRFEKQKSNFKTYAPELYNAILSAEFVKTGNYIYFISYNDVNKVKNAIEQSYYK